MSKPTIGFYDLTTPRPNCFYCSAIPLHPFRAVAMTGTFTFCFDKSVMAHPISSLTRKAFNIPLNF